MLDDFKTELNRLSGLSLDCELARVSSSTHPPVKEKKQDERIELEPNTTLTYAADASQSAMSTRNGNPR